jgi:hypothetical protein
MPGMDRTGPMGQGPLTGRGFGPCNGGSGQGGGFGRGFRMGFGAGMGRGAGRGFRWRTGGFAAQQSVELSREDQRKILEQELSDLESEKEALKKRLEELR